jgi:hypothetical protein
MKYIGVLFTYLVVSLLSGCAVGGSSFVAPEAAPAGKSIVYFYRPWEMQGAAVGIAIYDNGQPAASVRAGQFVKYPVEPGQHNFVIAETIGKVIPTQLLVNPNETYFLRTGIRSGTMVNTLYITRIYPDEAIAELQQCCKSGE